MSKVNITVLFSTVCVFLLSGCLQNGTPFFSPHTPAPSSAQTFTPTTTLTVTITPTPSSTHHSHTNCKNNEPYIRTWSTEQNKVLFEAFLCPDGTLIAIFHNQDIPELMTINQKMFGQKEFAWEVGIDVDSDKTTGKSREWQDEAGTDYSLMFARWSTRRSNDKAKTVPFAEEFEINVAQCTSESCEMSSNAEFFIDRENKLLILKGVIPKISPKSQILFSRFYSTQDNILTYKTNWLNSNYVP